jgi:gas vesicle protein
MVPEDRMRRDDRASLLWFLAGVSIGAAATMILTPVSGAETRRLIGQKAGDARGFIRDSGREYYERGRELYEHGRTLADEAAELFEEGRRLVEGEET